MRGYSSTAEVPVVSVSAVVEDFPHGSICHTPTATTRRNRARADSSQSRMTVADCHSRVFAEYHPDRTQRLTCPPKPPTVASRRETIATPSSASPSSHDPRSWPAHSRCKGSSTIGAKPSPGARPCPRRTRDPHKRTPLGQHQRRLVQLLARRRHRVLGRPLPTMALGFGHQRPSVKLTGPCVPAISVWTAHRIYGDPWSARPTSAGRFETAEGRRRRCKALTSLGAM